MMRGTVEAEQTLERYVPELTRRNALRRQGQPLRHRKPVVTQHGSDQLVGEDLGSMRPHGDGSPSARLANQLVCLFWSLGVLVRDRREFGLDGGGHGVDYLRFAPGQDRSKVVFLQRGVVDIRACADVLEYTLVACWLA
jgi:hypothetical protein